MTRSHLHRFFHRIFRITLFSSLLFSSQLLAAPTPIPKPQQPDIDVNAYILIDHRSGQILAEKNADEPVEPASLTKIMTAYVVADELEKGTIKPDDLVKISEKAWRTGGSSMFVEVDTYVPVEDLLRGVIIQSGNDASIALAEYISGSESAFAELMNYHAAQLGLNNTYFINSSGLPDEHHITTARDLATLSRALINHFPEVYAIHAERRFTHNNIAQNNRNLLLWRDDSVDGVKTGHTEAAGYCVVGSAQRGDMRLISVLTGSQDNESRASQSQTLLNYGFRFYESHKLYDQYTPIQEIRLWKGKRKVLPVGVEQDIYVTTLRGRYEALDVVSESAPHAQAPVAQGQPFGTLTISFDNEVLQAMPLVALEDVGRSNFVRRFIDQIRLFFHRLFSK